MSMGPSAAVWPVACSIPPTCTRRVNMTCAPIRTRRRRGECLRVATWEPLILSVAREAFLPSPGELSQHAVSKDILFLHMDNMSDKVR